MYRKNGEISVCRLKRYVKEKLKDIFEKIKSDVYEGQYIIWGIDILSLYNKRIEWARKQGFDKPQQQRKYAEEYIIRFCVKMIQGKLEVYCGAFSNKLYAGVYFATFEGISVIELNEIYLYVNHFDSYDAITNCAGVVRDMQLVEFGAIKAYVELIEDGILPIEIVSERIGMTVDEVERIMKRGVGQ